MADHRIRLDDREIDLVVHALTARVAGIRNPATQLEIIRLAERISDGGAGNPRLRFGWDDSEQQPQTADQEEESPPAPSSSPETDRA